MIKACPHCLSTSDESKKCPKVVRHGSFYRKSDSRWITRYRCLKCKKSFSNATSHPCFRQKKRQLNFKIYTQFCSGLSQRRLARNLKINRKTVVRKLLFLSAQAELKLAQDNAHMPKVSIVEFDDMETFEHTKCKPLSITVALEHKTRRILGLEVSQMPAKGLLAKIARKRYGKRQDKRLQGRRRLFERIKLCVNEGALIKSDQNPHYPDLVLRTFPTCTYETHLSRKGCVVGQGELKRGGFDPLFSLNHTCAKIRADVNRLVRKTWCTTKRPDRLQAHLNIYVVYHNEHLKLR